LPKSPFSSLVAKVSARVAGKEERPAPITDPDISGRVGFCVGTGRSGTHFIAALLEHEPEVAAVHERDPMLETFHRYCKWHDLPVDDEGYLHAMEDHIRRDLARHRLSFEASCHLSLSMRELERRFAPKFVLLVRHPRKVVKSHLGKGWYDGPVVQARPELALGYQPGGKFHHFLGRITPRGEELTAWNQLTRVGKLSWFWATLNQAVIDQAKEIPEARYRQHKLEDFDYTLYCEIAAFLGFTPQLTAKKFATVRDGSARKAAGDDEWTPTEWAEYEKYCAPLAAKLGYDLKG
jgi:hypothetical protein